MLAVLALVVMVIASVVHVARVGVVAVVCAVRTIHGFSMKQGGHEAVPLSEAHRLVAHIPFLGRDFGMPAWLGLQREAENSDRAIIKLRGREQERRVAQRTNAGRRALDRINEWTKIRRLTIRSSHGPKELMVWYNRVPCRIVVRETWVEVVQDIRNRRRQAGSKEVKGPLGTKTPQIEGRREHVVGGSGLKVKMQS